jgi:hypothetical protein
MSIISASITLIKCHYNINFIIYLYIFNYTKIYKNIQKYTKIYVLFLTALIELLKYTKIYNLDRTKYTKIYKIFSTMRGGEFKN